VYSPFKKTFALTPDIRRIIKFLMLGRQLNCRPNIKVPSTKWDLAPFMEQIHVLVYVIGSQSPFCRQQKILMRRAKEDVLGLFSFSFRFATPALRTDSKKLQSVTKYFIAAPIFLSAPRKCKGGPGGVVNSHAADASQMIVILHISVIARLCAAEI